MPKKMNLVLQQLRDEEGALEDVRRELAAETPVAPTPVAPAVPPPTPVAPSPDPAQLAAVARIQRFLRWRMRVKLWWEAYWDEEVEKLEREAERLEREYEHEERDWGCESCNVCGRPCDDDWGWTGHCSRSCATSYDRRDRW